MSKIKVTCEVQSCDNSDVKNILVHSHWNKEEMIIIEFEEKEITVLAHHLKAAIENCTNNGESI